MILFKVVFKDNKAIVADADIAHRPAIAWKENPYSIISMDIYANNNLQALQLAQSRANRLLKENR
ncbi:MAG: hypothetical protein QM726_21305 [Chitinophagaceae bacterium]